MTPSRMSPAQLAAILSRRKGGPRPKEARARKRQEKPDPCAGLLVALRLAGLPAPERERKFHPRRKWAFDLCWPDLMVAAELEGGAFSRGRHVRGKGFAEDAHKYSEAAILGWLVVRFTTEQLKSGLALDLIQRAIEAARGRTIRPDTKKEAP